MNFNNFFMDLNFYEKILFLKNINFIEFCIGYIISFNKIFDAVYKADKSLWLVFLEVPDTARNEIGP